MRLVRALAIVATLLVEGGGTLWAQAPAADNLGFTLVERTPLGGSNAGTMFRYQRTDGAGIDLFVTPLPPSLDPCVMVCAMRAVDALSAQFADALVAAADSSDSLRLAGTTSRAPPEGSWLEQGRLTALRERRGGVSVDWFLWLFLGQETLVQVRGAHPAGAIDFTTLNRVVNTLVLGIPSPYDCPYGVSNDSAQVQFVPLGFGMHKLPSLVDSTLTALGYRFAYRNVSAGLWRTVPGYTWPDAPLVSQAATDIRPGIVLVANVTIDSAWSLLAVSARPACRVPAATRRAVGAPAALAQTAMRHAADAILDAVGIVQ